MRTGWRVERVMLWAMALVAAAGAAWFRFEDAVRRSDSPRDIAHRLRARYAVDGQPAAARAAPFVDVAAELGIEFTHDSARRGRYLLPEEMGPGCGLLDFDNDGDLDLFVAGGGAILDNDGPTQSCRLFRNDGSAFTDVTDESGAGVIGPAFGIACADADDDGDVDVFITRLGSNVLLRNEGPGRFTDVTDRAGVGDAGFGTGACFVDYDRDGDLDLYVAKYVDWSPQRERSCATPWGEKDYCSPLTYGAPSADRLFRNDGGCAFVDVTVDAGMSHEQGNGLGVVAEDFDDDGWPDIYVANDMTPAFLWKNNRDGTFTNVAPTAGCAYDRNGVAIAGMGVACEDLDDDGDFDLLVTNITEQTHLYLRNDRGAFRDESLALGLGRWSMAVTGFGIAFLDQDNDGTRAAYIANGAVNMRRPGQTAENPYAEPDHFARLLDGRLVDVTTELGDAPAHMSRAVASGDIDGDGDVDLVVSACGGPLRILRNTTTSRGPQSTSIGIGGPAPERHWITLDLRTRGGVRHALGTRVRLRAGPFVACRAVRPHAGYLASSDSRIHIGLGAARVIESIEIDWPDGSSTTLRDVDANQVLRIDQSSSPATIGRSQE